MFVWAYLSQLRLSVCVGEGGCGCGLGVGLCVGVCVLACVFVCVCVSGASATLYARTLLRAFACLFGLVRTAAHKSATWSCSVIYAGVHPFMYICI